MRNVSMTPYQSGMKVLEDSGIKFELPAGAYVLE